MSTTTHTTRVISEFQKRTGFSAQTYVPFIRIRGKWLTHELGIIEGDNLIARVENGKLIIEKIPPKPAPKPSYTRKKGYYQAHTIAEGKDVK